MRLSNAGPRRLNGSGSHGRAYNLSSRQSKHDDDGELKSAFYVDAHVALSKGEYINRTEKSINTEKHNDTFKSSRSRDGRGTQAIVVVSFGTQRFELLRASLDAIISKPAHQD